MNSNVQDENNDVCKDPPLRGMVFGLSVLNRVYNFMRACPKQGMVSTIVVVKYILYGS